MRHFCLCFFRARHVGLYLQLLWVGVCILDSDSSFTSLSPPPLSLSPRPCPTIGSGLLLGLLPFVGDAGSGTLIALLYAVTSPSSSSSALWYCGLISRLAKPLLAGESDGWCLNHPLPAVRHRGGLCDRLELLASLYSEPMWLRKPECWDGMSGMVGENSRASKSSMEAAMLEWEARYCWRAVMTVCVATIHAAGIGSGSV